MKDKHRCSYENMSEYRGTPPDVSWRHGHHKAVKRKRVTCPECGRRMWAWRAVCHDGCCISYRIPPHKKKGWWKNAFRAKAKKK